MMDSLIFFPKREERRAGLRWCVVSTCSSSMSMNTVYLLQEWPWPAASQVRPTKWSMFITEWLNINNVEVHFCFASDLTSALLEKTHRSSHSSSRHLVTIQYFFFFFLLPAPSLHTSQPRNVVIISSVPNLFCWVCVAGFLMGPY